MGVNSKSNEEVHPASDGIKVEFKVTDEILKKYEKIAATGARTKNAKKASNRKKIANKAGKKIGTNIMLHFSLHCFFFVVELKFSHINCKFSAVKKEKPAKKPKAPKTHGKSVTKKVSGIFAKFYKIFSLNSIVVEK